MGNLRPIGSEKLQGMDKINRMIEISRYKENKPNPINEDKSVEYTKTLADGKTYRIDREKNGYVIKKTISESVDDYDYVEPMKNRKYYSSYSQALKRLNLIVKEVNSNEGYSKGMSLFNESEKSDETKYVLNVGGETTEQAAPAPAPAPAPAAATPAPAPSPEPAPAPTDELGGEDLGMEDEMGDEEQDDEPITLKVIQKLTGKLGEKLRGFEEHNEEPMSSKDIKYVINSILSAIDVESLDEEDREDIMNKLEGVEDEEGMDDDMGFDEEGMGDEEGMTPEEPTGEVAEDYEFEDEFDVDYEDDYGFADDFDTDAPTRERERIKTPERERERERERETEKPIRRIPNPYKPGKREEELPNPEAGRGRHTPKVHGGGERQKHFYEEGINMFGESKIDKVLSKYFITENENKPKKPINENYRKHSVNVIQEMMSVKFMKKYPNSTFVGKTNKDNLVFEHNNKTIRITPKGDII
jgi:hypothetical protein